MKVLFLDIETSPNVVYRFEKLSTPATSSVEKLIEPSRILVVGYKWEDTEPAAVTELAFGQKKMATILRDLLDEADVVVHYNGARFDVPHLNRILVEHGLAPPSSYRQVDLYHTVRRMFNLPSNRLLYVAHWLRTNGKIGDEKSMHEEFPGFALWEAVLAKGRDKKTKERRLRAVDEMVAYCLQDVILTQEVYSALFAYAPNLPNAALYSGDEAIRCTGCGSTEVTKAGLYRTNAGAFQRYQCKECRRYSRSTQRVETTPLRLL